MSFSSLTGSSPVTRLPVPIRISGTDTYLKEKEH